MPIFPFQLNRLSGIPFQVFEKQSLFWKTAYQQYLQQLQQAQSALIEALFVEKKMTSDYPYKARLSSQILNARALKKVKLKSLAPELEVLMTSYHSLRAERAERLEAYTVAFESVLAVQRVALKSALSPEAIKMSILATDAAAYNAIEKYKQASNTALNKKARQSELLALKFITRAAKKSSPFAGFGHIAWSNSDEAVSKETKTVVKVNQALLVYIEEALMRNKLGRNIYKIRLNPSLQISGNEYEFILNVRNKEQFQKVEVQPVLESLVEVLRDGMLSFQDLLAAALEIVEADTSTLIDFLDNLIRTGFIVPVYPANREDRDWVERWIQALEGYTEPEMRSLRSLLAEVQLLENKSASIATIKAAQELHGQWRQWFSTMDPSFKFDLKKERLFYFDSYKDGSDYPPITDDIHTIANTIAERIEALNFNEEKIAFRQKLKRLTKDQPSVSLVDLYKDYFSGEALDIEHFLKSYEARIVAIKKAIKKILSNEAAQVHIASIDLMACIPKLELNRVGWPGFIFQVGADSLAKAELPYFSSSFIGMGKMMSRFIRRDQNSLAEQVALKIAQNIPQATTLSDASAFNPNLKPDFIQKPIGALLADQNSRPSYKLCEVRVAWSGEDPVLIDREKNELCFIPYGLEIPERRSPLYRLLSLFAPSYPDIALLRRVIASLTKQVRKGHVFIPRVVVDEALVIQRACWEVDLGHVPRKVAGQSLAVYYLELGEWLSEAGMPSEFFFKSKASEKYPAKLTKPQYFSIHQPILIQLFHQAISKMSEGEDTLIMEEVYPQCGKYVREVVVE